MQIDECILWLSIIFITILCTPQPTIVRWSSTPPVSDEIRLQWKGFCALIANAYYVKGMAWWVSVKTLKSSSVHNYNISVDANFIHVYSLNQVWVEYLWIRHHYNFKDLHHCSHLGSKNLKLVFVSKVVIPVIWKITWLIFEAHNYYPMPGKTPFSFTWPLQCRS